MGKKPLRHTSECSGVQVLPLRAAPTGTHRPCTKENKKGVEKEEGISQFLPFLCSHSTTSNTEGWISSLGIAPYDGFLTLPSHRVLQSFPRHASSTNHGMRAAPDIWMRREEISISGNVRLEKREKYEEVLRSPQLPSSASSSHCAATEHCRTYGKPPRRRSSALTPK